MFQSRFNNRIIAAILAVVILSVFASASLASANDAPQSPFYTVDRVEWLMSTPPWMTPMAWGGYLMHLDAPEGTACAGLRFNDSEGTPWPVTPADAPELWVDEDTILVPAEQLLALPLIGEPTGLANRFVAACAARGAYYQGDSLTLVEDGVMLHIDAPEEMVCSGPVRWPLPGYRPWPAAEAVWLDDQTAFLSKASLEKLVPYGRSPQAADLEGFCSLKGQN